MGLTRAVAVRTFLLFLIVTRDTLGTGFMPSFCIAFLLFFSERLCLPRPVPVSSAVIEVQPSELAVLTAIDEQGSKPCYKRSISLVG